MHVFGHKVGPDVYCFVFFGFGTTSLTGFFLVRWATGDWNLLFGIYFWALSIAIVEAFLFAFHEDWDDGNGKDKGHDHEM